MRKNVAQYRIPTDFDSSNPQHVNNLNKILQNLGDRLDTIQQIGAKTPSTPLNVATQGKQGLITVTWNRIQNVDGYVITWSTSSGMIPIAGRTTIHDSDSCDFRLPIGNAVATYFFTVSAFVGNKVGNPSVSVSGASIAFTTVGTAPTDAPKTPRAAKIAVPRNGTTLS